MFSKKTAEKGPQSQPTEKPKGGSGKSIIIAGIIIAAVAAVLFAPGGVLAKQKEGMCIPSSNSIYVPVEPGTYNIPNSGQRVTVVRGVMNGETSVGSELNTELPDCFSSDPGLVQAHNLWVYDEKAGHPVVFPVAVIVNEVQEVTPEAETPLP